LLLRLRLCYSALSLLRKKSKDCFVLL